MGSRKSRAFRAQRRLLGSPKPYLDQIIFRFIVDPAAAVAAIETGEVQVSTANLPLTDIDRLKANPNLVVDTDPAPYSPSIARAEFNLENKYLADIKVRHAIAHAVDKDFIVNTVYLGYATRLDGPVSPDLAKFYSPDLPKYEFDPAKSEKLWMRQVTRAAPMVSLQAVHRSDPAVRSSQADRGIHRTGACQGWHQGGTANAGLRDFRQARLH